MNMRIERGDEGGSEEKNSGQCREGITTLIKDISGIKTLLAVKLFTDGGFKGPTIS